MADDLIKLDVVNNNWTENQNREKRAKPKLFIQKNASAINQKINQKNRRQNKRVVFSKESEAHDGACPHKIIFQK